MFSYRRVHITLGHCWPTSTPARCETPGGRRLPSGPLGSRPCRKRWRALLLIIRAKLEAVESGITTLESEFLANIVLPDGGTVGQWLAPQIDAAYATVRLPLMPGPSVTLER